MASARKEPEHSSFSSWARRQKSRLSFRKRTTATNPPQQASGEPSQRLSQASEEVAQTSSNINPQVPTTANSTSQILELSQVPQTQDTDAPAANRAAKDLPRERITETPEIVSNHNTSEEKENSAFDTLWAKAIKLLQTNQPEKHARLMLLSKQHGGAEPDLESLMENERKKHHYISLAAEDTIRNILNFKDLAISIAALDPTKATTIVLRGFSYIGQALIDNETLFRDHELDIRRVTSRLRHWMNVESWYLQSNATEDNETDHLRTMKGCLLDLYSTKLEVMVLLYEAYDQSRPARLVLPRTAAWKDAIKRWDESDKACQLEFDRFRGNVDRCLTIRKWITDHDAEKDHDDVKINIKLKEYPSCGQWLLDSDQYKAWLSSESFEAQDTYTNVIWVRGTVGTGKTSLMARVIEQHRLTSYAHRNHRLAYFYCADQEGSARKSYQNVLQSLLRQAAYDPVRGTVIPAIRRAYSQGESSFLFSKCEDLLMAIVEEGIKLRIIVDALDECDDSQRLLKALHNIVESAPGQCQLLVSGRPEVEVQRRFASAVVVDVQEETTFSDMQTYITKEIKLPDNCERIFGGKREDLETRLIDVLNRKANGMFEWVRLQLALFTAFHETGSADMLQDLEELENDATLVGLKELNKIYDKIFNKNTRDKRTSREAAKFMYQILIACPFGLDIEYMIYLLNIRISSGEELFTSTDVLKYGSNFITNVQDRNLPAKSYLEFTHISAKQYLQSEHEGYDSTTCDITSLRSCIKHWGESDFNLKMAKKVSSTRFHAQRFFTGWFSLCWNRLSRNEREESGILQLFLDCLVYGEGKSSFEYWLSKARRSVSIHRSSKINAPSMQVMIQSPLDFAAYWGFTDIVEAICASPREHVLERTVNRALFFAKHRGRMETVGFLFNRFQITNPKMEFDLSDLTPEVSKDSNVRIIRRTGGRYRAWTLIE